MGAHVSVVSQTRKVLIEEDIGALGKRAFVRGRDCRSKPPVANGVDGRITILPARKPAKPGVRDSTCRGVTLGWEW